MIMFIIPTRTPVLQTNKVGIVNTSWSIFQISALKETLGIWVKPYIGVFVENRPYNAHILWFYPHVYPGMCLRGSAPIWTDPTWTTLDYPYYWTTPNWTEGSIGLRPFCSSMHLQERLAFDLTNMIWNTAGLTGDARCCSAIAHEQDHGRVSNLILLIEILLIEIHIFRRES